VMHGSALRVSTLEGEPMLLDDGTTMTKRAVQDSYPAEFNHCFGCGCLNEHGHQLKSYWSDESGEDVVASFVPKPYHMAGPGFVYGGLIASLVDCHGTGAAAAFSYRAEGREMGSSPVLRYVTASLKVDYLKPTPLGPTLQLRARAREIRKRKVIVDIELFADDILTVRGEVIAVRIPESMLSG
jgi:acyl-coenzyme A thioesterase PaaI-like protein